METTQMSIKGWTDKQDAVGTYSKILLSHEKEWNTHMCYNADDPWKHYAGWKKTDIRGHTCMIPFMWNIWDKETTKQIGGFQGLGGGENEEWLIYGYEVSFWNDENVLELDRSGDCTTLWVYWISLMLTFKCVILCYVNFTELKKP